MMKHLLFLFLTITIFSASGQSLQNDLKAYDSLECRMSAYDLDRLFDTLKDIVYIPDMRADSLIPITTDMFNIAGCLNEHYYSAEAWRAFAHVYKNSILIMVYPKGYQSSLRNALYYYKRANNFHQAGDIATEIAHATSDNCGINKRWAKKAIRLYSRAQKRGEIDVEQVMLSKAQVMLLLGQRYNRHDKIKKAIVLWKEALEGMNSFNSTEAIKVRLQLLAELSLIYSQIGDNESSDFYNKEMVNLRKKLSEK